ncbi:hypothetical protein GVAV_000517 [Gurleya vavrai]
MIKLIGSFETGISTFGSDLDVVLLFKEKENIDILCDDSFGNRNEICSKIYTSDFFENEKNEVCIKNKEICEFAFKNDEFNEKTFLKKIVEIVSGRGFIIENILDCATFPILKLRNIKFGIKIDLSINQINAIKNTELLKDIFYHYKEIKQITILVKLICKMFDINCSYRCTLNSYALSLMTIFYFQRIFDISPIFSKRKKLLNENTCLLDYLKGFFYFYAFVFDFESEVVSVKLGKYKKKDSNLFKAYSARYNFCFCIEDPIITDFNVTRTVNDESLKKIIGVFKVIFNLLNTYNTKIFI